MRNYRIIPRLDIKGTNLVKGIHLEGLRVLGNPEEFAFEYYKKGADEILYQDVVASLYKRNSLLDQISKINKKIFIPLIVGGGVRSIDDIKKIKGSDKIIRNKKGKQLNFEIRFHLEPNSRVMKTQDNKNIYIECENEGWKFISEEYNINFETGLFFGLKNQFLENQNIVISGIIQSENKEIKWEIQKI